MDILNTQQLARIIDHTILKPDATIDDIKRLCNEALEYHFYSVCINPWWVVSAKEILKSCDVSVCTVIGFPLGMTDIKALEAERAVKAGADELDMVIAVGALKSGMYDEVYNDIKAVVGCGVPVKVILETCLLTTDELVKACDISVDAGAAFVKTSTGFSQEGAREDDVRLMKDRVGDKALVKASGGIRNYHIFRRMVEAGASRIGCSSSIAIIQEAMNG